jgi:hypothetical protein
MVVKQKLVVEGRMKLFWKKMIVMTMEGGVEVNMFRNGCTCLLGQ